jgi:hypothetical protein
MPLTAAGDVVVQSRSHDEVLDNQIAVQFPDKLIRFAGFWVGISKAPEGRLDAGVVLLDCF